MTVPEMIPHGAGAGRPSIAGVYDCFLGGTDNHAADREVFARALAIAPEAPRGALANRAFLWRAVHYLAGQAGIRRFLDIGSGLPTRGNVHQAARHAAGPARVVYVDNDPAVVARSRALLARDPAATAIAGDIRQPEEILASPPVRELTEAGQPVALILAAILHHVSDEDGPAGIAARLRRALPPGSYLAISHLCNPHSEHPGRALTIARTERLLAETLGTGRFRTRQEILAYFGDLDLIEPGLVPLAEWRPGPGAIRQPDSVNRSSLGGLARKG